MRAFTNSENSSNFIQSHIKNKILSKLKTFRLNPQKKIQFIFQRRH